MSALTQKPQGIDIAGWHDPNISTDIKIVNGRFDIGEK